LTSHLQIKDWKITTAGGKMMRSKSSRGRWTPREIATALGKKFVEKLGDCREK